MNSRADLSIVHHKIQSKKLSSIKDIGSIAVNLLKDNDRFLMFYIVVLIAIKLIRIELLLLLFVACRCINN